MERGDISNLVAITLAIDIDGLIFIPKIKRSFFGFRQTKELEVNLRAMKVLDHHMLNGRMIYLIAHRDDDTDYAELESMLEEMDFPYHRLFIVDAETREMILSRPHVHYYFYMDPLHFSTDNKRKERRILNIAETYF